MRNNDSWIVYSKFHASELQFNQDQEYTWRKYIYIQHWFKNLNTTTVHGISGISETLENVGIVWQPLNEKMPWKYMFSTIVTSIYDLKRYREHRLLMHKSRLQGITLNSLHCVLFSTIFWPLFVLAH